MSFNDEYSSISRSLLAKTQYKNDLRASLRNIKNFPKISFAQFVKFAFNQLKIKYSEGYTEELYKSVYKIVY